MEPEAAAAAAAAAQAERLARLQGDAPAVCAALEASLSPDPAVRTPAETSLRAAEGAPGFCSLLLQIATADGVAGHVQQAAALVVKNAVGAEGLAPAEREQVRGEILQHMAGLVGGAGGPRDVALGAAACRAAGCGGAAACATLVREAMALLGVGQPLLAILASLPDECASAEQAGLAALNGELLKTVGAVLAGQGADEQLPLVREAIRVLVSWLQGGGLTIDVLHDSGMMALLAPALLAPPLFSATAELFTGLCEGCGAASDAAATQLITTLMAQMVSLEAAVAAAIAGANEESTQFSLELAYLLGALARRVVPAPPLLQATPEAACVMRIGLSLAGHPDATVRESTLELWAQMASQLGENTAGSAQATSLLKGQFLELLGVLLQSCAFPSDFESWQDSSISVDEDAWGRFRRVAASVFCDCVQVIGPEEVVQLLCSAFGNAANTWQALEAGLFALACIRAELAPKREGIMRRLPSAASSLPPFAASALGGVFEVVLRPVAVVAPGSPAAHPLVRAAALRLAGAYAGWLASDAAALEAAIGLAADALSRPEPGCAARFICELGRANCRQFGNMDLLDRLLSVVPTQLETFGTETGALLIEGVARGIGGGDPAKIHARLEMLIGPLALQLRSAAEAAREPGVLSVLQMLRAAVQFLNVGAKDSPPSGHPVTAIIQAVWPDVMRSASIFCGSNDVGAALTELTATAMRCSQDVAIAMSASVAELIAACSAAAPLCASWLDLLTVFIESSGRARAAMDAGAGERVAQLAKACTANTLAAAAQSDAASSSAATAAALDVGFRCAMFCQQALLDADYVRELLQTAVASLATDQREPARSACMLLPRLCRDVGNGELPTVAAWFASASGSAGVADIFVAAATTGFLDLVPKLLAILTAALPAARSLSAEALAAQIFERAPAPRGAGPDGVARLAAELRCAGPADAGEKARALLGLWRGA